MDCIVHSQVRFLYHSPPIISAVRPDFFRFPYKFFKAGRARILHNMFHLNTRLIGNGGDTQLEPFELAETWGDNRNFQRASRKTAWVGLVKNIFSATQPRRCQSLAPQIVAGSPKARLTLLARRCIHPSSAVYKGCSQ